MSMEKCFVVAVQPTSDKILNVGRAGFAQACIESLQLIDGQTRSSGRGIAAITIPNSPSECGAFCDKVTNVSLFSCQYLGDLNAS